MTPARAGFRVVRQGDTWATYTYRGIQFSYGVDQSGYHFGSIAIGDSATQAKRWLDKVADARDQGNPAAAQQLRAEGAGMTEDEAGFEPLRSGDEWASYRYRGVEFAYYGVGNAGYYTASVYIGRTTEQAKRWIDEYADRLDRARTAKRKATQSATPRAQQTNRSVELFEE